METTLSAEHAGAVQKIIARIVEVPLTQITPEAKFVEDFGADSLTVMELILALEEHFNITIPDEVAERCATVGELYNALARLLPR